MIEAISQCPVQFGRVSRLGKATDFLQHYKKNSVTFSKASGLSREELAGRIVIGEFVDIEKPELSSQWTDLKYQMGQEAQCHNKH